MSALLGPGSLKLHSQLWRFVWLVLFEVGKAWLLRASLKFHSHLWKFVAVLVLAGGFSFFFSLEDRCGCCLLLFNIIRAGSSKQLSNTPDCWGQDGDPAVGVCWLCSLVLADKPTPPGERSCPLWGVPGTIEGGTLCLPFVQNGGWMGRRK